MSSWIRQPHTKPLLIAHRGASYDEPENTLTAFRLAAEQGADGLEFDVQLSADDVPVIFHDAKLERTTNGRGKVADQTFEQLQQWDAGGGNKILSLKQLFAEFDSTLLYNIEIKAYRLKNNGLEKSVADLVDRFSLEKQVLVSSFLPASLRRFRRYKSAETLTALVRYKGFGFTHRFFDGEADHPHSKLVDERYMRWAANKNHRVHVWTVDDLAEAQRLTKLGVHGLITNRPGYMQAHL
ncbi:MAG: glycerophosphodiester phosphodiesterase [Anaerolineae bacterium]